MGLFEQPEAGRRRTVNRRIFCVAPAITVLLFLAPAARADAQADLAAGNQALARGDLDDALGLLTAAAQALPQNAEAQAALGQVQLRLGKLEDALKSYEAALRLLPQHVQIRRIVEALKGERATFDQKLAFARSLMELQAYSTARNALAEMLNRAADTSQRMAVLLASAECDLWANDLAQCQTEAMRVVSQSGNAAHVAQAKVVAGLGLFGTACSSEYSRARADQAAALLKDIGPLPAPWKARLDLVNLSFEAGMDPSKAPQVSAKLAGPLASIPPGPFRDILLSRLTQYYIMQATLRVESNDEAAATAILWPMVSGGSVPGADAGLKPIAITGGWLTRDRAARALRIQVADAMAAVARDERVTAGAKAMLLGYRLAGAVLLDLDPAVDAVPHDRLRVLAGELADASRPADGRKAGEPLSLADEMQREIILQLASQVTELPRRISLMALIEGQLARHEQAGDAETGIARFVTIQDSAGADAKAPKTVKVDLAAPLADWAGPARQQLCLLLGQACERLGDKAFRKEAATMDLAANSALNRFDQAAIILYALASPGREAGSPPAAMAQRIMDRYSGASRWEAVEAASALFHAGRGEDAVWATVNLKIRRAIVEEDKLLAARKGLPAGLPAALTAALVEARKLIPPGAESAERNRATSLAQSLISRYEAMDRADLAEAVIVAFVGPAPAGQGPVPLADWATWTRAELLDRQAAAALARLAEQFDGSAKLKLHDLHAQELKLLDDIVAKYPRSPYAAAAVARVLQISSTYRVRKAWAPAEAVLAGFVKAHPGTSATGRVRYALVQLALTKAQSAFSDRKDKDKKPEKLSDEYAAAIDALAGFLKDGPDGDYEPAVVGDLFAVARTYGQEGAWGVSRTVLARFAAAVPEFKDPLSLKFLQAATYLGELDRGHGLELLQLPARPSPQPSGRESGAAGAGLAMGFLGRAGEGGKHTELAAATKPAGARPAGAGNGKGYFPEPPPPVLTPPGERAKAKRDFDAELSEDEVERIRPASDTAIAAIRASEQAGTRRLAMMREELVQGQAEKQSQQKGLDIVLPGGAVLSEAEMSRQDAAADAAYAILIELVKDPKLVGQDLPLRARQEVLWLFGFFEGQSRPDRAAGVIEKFLADQPTDPHRLALSLRFLRDRLAWAGHVGPTDRIDLAWIDQRHQRFEQVRAKLSAMLKDFAEHKDWVRDGRMLAVESYQLEAERAASVSAVRSAGLLAQAAQELLAISRQAPEDPAVAGIPQRLWEISTRLEGLRQDDQAVHVLGEIPTRFPTDPLAVQAVLRIAELHADRLGSPLRAVETYQEFLSLSGDREDVRKRIFDMGQQLAGQQRYLEAMHVLGVFVDSFPADARAPQALMAIGQTHQANSAWDDAIGVYRRISTEYPSSDVMAQVQIAIAECQINLSDWKAARKTYEDYLQKYAGAAPPNAPAPAQPSAAQQEAPQQAAPPVNYAEMARRRIEILKNLDRYQTLLADKLVTRNKDDAQFQIARIVMEDMRNLLKAAAEFRKVVEDFPKSDQAAAAQLEIGKALLALARTEDARKELLKVPANYPNSPLADQALHLVGLSYEQQAQRLAGISVQTVKAEMFQKGQQAAYESYQQQERDVGDKLRGRRAELQKKAGDNKELLENEEAYNAARFNGMSSPNIIGNVRQAQQQAETASALQLANRQDRINEAYRQAVAVYAKAAADYPLGTKTGSSLEHMAIIYEVHLKDPAAAMAAYQRVVELFPGTSVAENAAMKVARFHEQQGKYDLAVNAYRDFIRTYPASSQVANAQYSLAEALEQQGRWVEAMEAYQTFRDKFSSHPAAAKALEQIQWIKAYRK
jgi:TolA-binding protein